MIEYNAASYSQVRSKLEQNNMKTIVIYTSKFHKTLHDTIRGLSGSGFQAAKYYKHTKVY